MDLYFFTVSPGLFSEVVHQREGITNFKNRSLSIYSPSMLDMSFGRSGSRFYMSVLFSQAPLEALGGFALL